MIKMIAKNALSLPLCLRPTNIHRHVRWKMTSSKKPIQNYRPKKDKGPRYPLPEIQGELLWGVHPTIAALLVGRRQVYAAMFKFLPQDGVDNARVREIHRLCSCRDIHCQMVVGSVLDELAGHHPHQGVCLDVSPIVVPTIDVDRIACPLLNAAGFPCVWMLPYRVQDTMNMGAILRSAFYFGVDKIVLPKHYSSALNSVVSKASAGAMEMMDIHSVSTDQQMILLLQKWKQLGGCVLGTTCEDITDSRVVPVHHYHGNQPTLLIMGNEAKGMSERLTDLCDTLLFIPSLQGTNSIDGHVIVDSLNVSVATGIILHTMMKNRR